MTQLRVPGIDLSRFEADFLEKLLPRVESLIRKTQFVSAPVIKELESKLASYLGTQEAIGCANGTDALQLALRAVGIGPGDRVLIPDMTFWASFEAVVNVGATPVTVDVNLDTFHLDFNFLQEAVEKFHPKALMLVHLYGWAAPCTDEVRSFCKKNKITLIEDGAQAFGTRWKGKELLGTAELTTTSFYPAKVLGASGDAGAIFTSNAEVAKKIRCLVDHGRIDHYSHGDVGWNSRLGAYEATFLDLSLDYFKARTASRQKICKTYREELKGLPLECLASHPDCVENAYVPVARMKVSERGAFMEHMTGKNITCRVIYPGAMSLQPGAQAYLGGKISKGHADLIAKSVVNLPCFSYMTDGELSYVIDSVKAYFS